MRAARLLLALTFAWASFAAAEPPAGEYVIAVDDSDGLVLPSGVFPEVCDDDTPDGLPERFNLGLGWVF